MRNEYAYIALFEYADDGINISFPDLPGCFSCAPKNNTDIALKNAKEALGLHIFDMEQSEETIPEPSFVFDLKYSGNRVPVLINVFMPSVRASVRTSFVKKTVSLPAWLAAEADEKKVNCSKLFQEALISYMNL